jgi:hypothetical protein
VYSEKDETAIILTGEFKPNNLYINGKEIFDFENLVDLKAGNNSIVAGYKKAGKSHLILAKSADNGESYPLAMKWYTKEDMFKFNCYAKKIQ